VEEGIALRQAGVTVPILVLGGIFGPQAAQFIAHDLEITVSRSWAMNCAACGPKMPTIWKSRCPR